MSAAPGLPLSSAFPPSRRAEHDSDSDSDLSLEEDPSGSYGSTHSSDSEDEAGGTAWDALLRPEQPPTPTGKRGSEGGLGAPWVPRLSAGPKPAGDGAVAPARPYWPGEFVTTASESDGHGGTEPLRVEPVPGGEGPPRLPPLLPLPHPHKGTGHPWVQSRDHRGAPRPSGAILVPAGILKKRGLPPISERGTAPRPPPPPAGTAASSGSEGSQRGGPGGPRPRQSLQEQLSGAAPIAMSIKAGTVDEDSSGSE